MRIGPKLTVTVLTLALIPLVIAGIYGYFSALRLLREQTRERLISISLLKESELKRYVNDRLIIVQNLSRRPSLRDQTLLLITSSPESEEFKRNRDLIEVQNLIPTLDTRPEFAALFILQPEDGRLLTSSNSELEANLQADLPDLLAAPAQPLIKAPHYHPDTGQSHILIKSPIVDRGGQLIGLLGAYMKLEDVSQIMLYQSGMSASEQTYLVNPAGLFVTESRMGPGYPLKQKAESDGTKVCLQGQTGAGFYRDYTGAPVVGAYRWIPEYQMCIVSEVSEAEALAPIKEFRMIQIALTLITGIAAAITGLAIAGSLASPIRKLAAGAESIGLGDLDQSIVVSTKDEIGQAAAAFNRMAGNLRLTRAENVALFDQLRRSQAELEQRVEERTHELWRSTETLSTLLNAIEETVFLVEQDGRIVSANYTAVARLSRGSAEISGQNYFDLFPVETAAVRRRAADLAIQTRQPVTFEDQLLGRTYDNRYTPILSESGQVLRLALLSIDITARRIADEQLLRTAADLERSNLELERFAYVASHDLQEPLRMVASYLQLLERRYNQKLDPDAREFIRFAVDGATRMKTLINDLLSYSRVGTRGKEFKRTDCRTVLDQAIQNLDIAIQESQASIDFEPLPIVMADTSQMLQVFQNLIGNAIKFRGDQPLQIHIGVRELETEWEFFVSDNGIGFDPQFSDRIFIIFQRLHTREEYAGTGIGLAISKRIIERHGGRIWVDSVPGSGATFFFTLPKIQDSTNDTGHSVRTEQKNDGR